MSANNPLDAQTEALGYSTDPEVQVGMYMTGRVDREQQTSLFRLGNDETILEAVLTLEELDNLIESLANNAYELEQVINLGSPSGDISAYVKESIEADDSPVLTLLWSFVEDHDLWGEFAEWSNEVVNVGLLTGIDDG